ncbi:MAG: hypothetical protein J6Q16_04510 [Clostridia bacterium]|nr:hypothetical protein [Clostridia bacterium]
MTEKVLQNKNNGMIVLLADLAVLLAAIAGVVLGGIMLDSGKLMGLLAFIPSLILLVLGWIPLLGLRVLKPQEALVVTLFGKYVGTLKGDGFFWINPFSGSFNPAAKTKLSQSGDVSTPASSIAALAAGAAGGAAVNIDTTGNKISLKIMTLINSRQ